MKIEAGRFYRTRDGRKAGPIEPHPNHGQYSWRGKVEGADHAALWTEAGCFYSSGSPHDQDLVASDPSGTAASKAIDQITLDDFRRGVEKIHASYRLY